MKASKKALAGICALVMAATSLTAFGVSAADESAQTAVTQSEQAQEKTVSTKAGKVTAVNGTTLTVAMGEFTAKQTDAQSGSDTSAAAKKQRTKKKHRSTDEQTDTASKSAADQSSAEKQQNDTQQNDTQSADGQKASKRAAKRVGKGKHGAQFTENGTSQTIELTSDVTLKKHGKTITAADISEGDIIKLKYDQNNKLVEVKVSTKHKRRSSSEKNAAKQTDSSSAASADVQSSATP